MNMIETKETGGLPIPRGAYLMSDLPEGGRAY